MQLFTDHFTLDRIFAAEQIIQILEGLLIDGYEILLYLKVTN